MKALTVQQPWAWCLVAGHKPIENRTLVWKHRGPLAIHAGTRWSERGGSSRLVIDAAWNTPEITPAWNVTSLGRADERWHYGAIIGLVDVVDMHLEHDGCCDSPWAETSYVEHGGRERKQLAHMVVERPVMLEQPVPCRGALGLWTVPQDVEAQVQLQLEAVRHGA